MAFQYVGIKPELLIVVFTPAHVSELLLQLPPPPFPVPCVCSHDKCTLPPLAMPAFSRFPPLHMLLCLARTLFPN